MSFRHISVLLNETIDSLKIRENGIYVDCTLGGGGHTSEIVKRVGQDGRVIGIDQDLEALGAAKERLSEYKDNIIFAHSNFYKIKDVVSKYNIGPVDGVLFDLGVSSYQLDEVSRGFSYMHDAPLDMRMNKDESTTAEDLINEMSSEKLTRIIKEYGEEKWAARIAQFIVQYRIEKRITTTGQLVEIIKAAVPASARREGPHPAKRTFQALRIAVNDELNRFAAALKDAVDILRPGGRVCVISFHSLEDRIAKEVFKDLAVTCECPPDFPVCRCNRKKEVEIITRKPIVPSEEEVETNPRARSAKLRVAEKCGVLKDMGVE